MIKSRITIIVLCLSLIITALAGCGERPGSSQIVLTIWHVYGDQSDSPLNEYISQFNETIGKEQGIRVVVTSVGSTNNIHQAVLSAIRRDPGAPSLPDMFISHPKTIVTLEDIDILVDYLDYFTDAELALYVRPFVEEGIIDNKLLIFPVAKSTELLFVNKTLFDRFAGATGAVLSDLATWEGLFETARLYAEWTEAQAQDTAGGKAFIAHDYPYHYMQIGVESLGESFFDDTGLSFGDGYMTVWEPLARAAILGGVWLEEGFASSGPMRTAEALVSIGSSASVLYNPSHVTYPDNTTEEVEIIALPCPVFRDGSELAVQRGGGFCTVKSTPEREAAAAVFLKWLTEPERNTSFTTTAGYLPVMEEAYDKYLEPAIGSLTLPAYIELYQAVLMMQASYTFHTPPNLPNYLVIEEAATHAIRASLQEARRNHISEPDIPIDVLVEEAFDNFRIFMR